MGEGRERVREALARGARVLAVVCAWCGTSLGVRPASPVTAGAVSHGMCPACVQRLAEERERRSY